MPVPRTPWRADDRLEGPREANVTMLGYLRDAEPDHRIAFFCECDRPDCNGAVWLTAGEYRERRATSQPIVLPGHRSAHPELR
jgi:hypothetical protein